MISDNIRMISDYTILKFINDLAGRWKGLDVLGIFCADWLIFVMPVVIILAYWISERREELTTLFLKIALSILIVYIFKYFVGLAFPRLRPFAELPWIKQLTSLFVNPERPAFFSNHTSIAFIMALAVILSWPKLGFILFFLAILVGLGRIFAGVHWPIDVLGGAVFGCFAFYFSHLLFLKLFTIFARRQK